MSYADTELQDNSTLILCIEDHDNITIQGKPSVGIDNRLFIGYEFPHYFIRGRRQDKNGLYVPFAFQCRSANNLFAFIQFVIGINRTSIVLYNFNNFWDNAGDKTYEFFEENMSRFYEIAAYDGVRLNRNKTVKQIKMLKQVHKVKASA